MGKNFGTMKKGDVYYTAKDLRKVDWNKMKRISGVQEPRGVRNFILKALEDYKDKKDKPYLKLSAVKKHLIIRFKLKDKHLDDFSVVENFVLDPSTLLDPTTDPDYARRVRQYGADREQCLAEVKQELEAAEGAVDRLGKMVKISEAFLSAAEAAGQEGNTVAAEMNVKKIAGVVANARVSVANVQHRYDEVLRIMHPFRTGHKVEEYQVEMKHVKAYQNIWNEIVAVQGQAKGLTAQAETQLRELEANQELAEAAAATGDQAVQKYQALLTSFQNELTQRQQELIGLIEKTAKVSTFEGYREYLRDPQTDPQAVLTTFGQQKVTLAERLQRAEAILGGLNVVLKKLGAIPDTLRTGALHTEYEAVKHLIAEIAHQRRDWQQQEIAPIQALIEEIDAIAAELDEGEGD